LSSAGRRKASLSQGGGRGQGSGDWIGFAVSRANITTRGYTKDLAQDEDGALAEQDSSNVVVEWEGKDTIPPPWRVWLEDEPYDGPPKPKPKPTSSTAKPPPKPTGNVSQKCCGLNRDKKPRYITHGAAFPMIESKFCPELLREAKLHARQFARKYHEGTPEAMELYV
jgi:hypothetical protein